MIVKKDFRPQSLAKKKKKPPSQNHPSKLNDQNKKTDDVYLNLREHLT